MFPSRNYYIIDNSVIANSHVESESEVESVKSNCKRCVTLFSNLFVDTNIKMNCHDFYDLTAHENLNYSIIFHDSNSTPHLIANRIVVRHNHVGVRNANDVHYLLPSPYETNCFEY